MSLNGVGIDRDNLVQSVQSNIAILMISELSNRSDYDSYRMLLSLLLRNLPSMLIAITRRPVSASISRTVNTVSYRIEFPTFLDESVLVATCKPIEQV